MPTRFKEDLPDCVSRTALACYFLHKSTCLNKCKLLVQISLKKKKWRRLNSSPMQKKLLEDCSYKQLHTQHSSSQESAFILLFRCETSWVNYFLFFYFWDKHCPHIFTIQIHLNGYIADFDIITPLCYSLTLHRRILMGTSTVNPVELI